MKKTLVALSTALLSLAPAWANDPKATLSDLDGRLGKIGAPKLEGTEKARDRTVPALFFGARRINNNYDVVDDVRKTTGASATVFVREAEDFVRVSTNVLTPEGKRGIGTTLARGKAYDALNQGQSYCGDVDVLGTPYAACYNPLRDGAGKIIGATYVGFRK